MEDDDEFRGDADYNSDPNNNRITRTFVTYPQSPNRTNMVYWSYTNLKPVMLEVQISKGAKSNGVAYYRPIRPPPSLLEVGVMYPTYTDEERDIYSLTVS